MNLKKNYPGLNLTLSIRKSIRWAFGCRRCGDENCAYCSNSWKSELQAYRETCGNKAEIVATESPEFLIEERNLQIGIYNSSTPEERDKAKERYEIKEKTLQQERDKYIASRINSTLKAGENGILFIGAEHNATPYMEEDIEVVDLVKRE